MDTILNQNKLDIKTIKIADQEWMVENLDLDHFRNGDIIPETKSNKDWWKSGEMKKPAWCYYKNKSENGIIYGKLYNWYAVNDPRSLAPEGWHIPSQNEFQKLIKAVNSDGNALKAVGQGKGKGAGTNTSGYSALLSGFRDGKGVFSYLGTYTYFRSSTEYDLTSQISISFVLSMCLGRKVPLIDLIGYKKYFGLSVRCIKD
jgi:uncharacterized protein (TIGR02145 family)